MNWILLTFILAPLFLGLGCLLFKSWRRQLSLLGAGYLLLLSLVFVCAQAKLSFNLLLLDGFSLLLICLVNLIGLVSLIASSSYMEKYQTNQSYYCLYLLLLSALNAILLSSHLLTMFLFMEAASFITYFLVAYGKKDMEIEAAFKYFVLGSIASMLIIFGLVLVQTLTGTLNLAQLVFASVKIAPKMQLLIVSLFLAGFGLKSALVPFHFWLADAHASAPAPVSATLSSVFIKVLGIYCMVRILFNLFSLDANIGQVLLILGSLSILVGGLMALVQTDLKRLYAYSSVSHIGYIALGFGIFTPIAVLGALMHILSHALFKAALFLSAGAIEQNTGTRNIDHLGGLHQKMPLTHFSAFIANLSLAGIPPLPGFWSKFFIILACVQAGKLNYAFIAAIGAIISLAYVLKVEKLVFFDRLPDKLAQIKEASRPMLIAIVSLAVIILAAGILSPFVLAYLINPAAIAVLNKLAYAGLAAGKM